MKRLKHVFDQICSLENLDLAEKKARRGKSKRRAVKKFLKNRDENLRKLSDMLRNGEYVTSEYTTFKVYEPKERVIYKLPYYPDRIVHHAIMNVLEERFTKTFIHSTYACLPGRGVHACLKDLRRDLRRLGRQGDVWCLQMDIQKFYPSIDHEILKATLRRYIGDKDLLHLLDSIIDSAPGVPIGNYLSQWFANLYLSRVDHYVKENLRVKFYYRYADDIVLISGDKSDLHKCRRKVGREIRGLSLRVKSTWSVYKICKRRGVDFLGYIFRPGYTLLRPYLKTRIKKEITIHHHIEPGRLGWLGWCNSKHLQEKYEIYV